MKGLYLIRDKVAETNAPPFVAPNDLVAIRQFQNMKYPPEIPRGDFELRKIGDFDANSPIGEIISVLEEKKDE